MSLDLLINAWPVMLIALLLALGVVITLALAGDVGARFGLEWIGLFFAAVPLAMVLGVIIQHRTLGVDLSEFSLPGGLNQTDVEDVATSNWANRIVTLVCLLLAAERSIRFVLKQQYRGAMGAPLLVSLLLYILAANFISAFLGSAPTFSHQYFYAPLFALALFAYAQDNAEAMVPLVRNTMLAFLVISLLALPVRLAMVAETNYRTGLIPGFGLRFYGFATHPNTLAPMCFLLMCCLYLRPFQARWLQVFGWFMAVLCLLLTQSKTSIGLIFVLMCILFASQAKAKARRTGGVLALRQTGLHLATITFLSIAAVGVSVLVVALSSDRAVSRAAIWFDHAQFASLSGRTAIWLTTLNELKANLLFGYGPGLWSGPFQQKTGLFFTHAHNQYLQTLGAAGIVGLSALLLYLCVLLRTAWQVRGPTRGVSLALVVYLILRGLTEVPLSVSAAVRSEFLVQMFVLVLCVGALRSMQSSESQEQQPRFAKGDGFRSRSLSY